MGFFWTSRQVDRAGFDRREAVLAAARERVYTTYARQAIELVGIIGNRLPAGRVIQVFTRLHSLDARDSSIIRMRVLAALAETMFANGGREVIGEQPAAAAPQAADQNSLLSALIHRRADRELRCLMEQHRARTEAVLMWTHVDNAVGFAQFFGERDTYPQAISDYLEAAELRPALAPAVFSFALERLSRDQFPASTGVSTLGNRSPAQLGVPAGDASVNGAK